MNNIDNSTIHQLIGRFLAGETTTAEEQTLYEFFSRDEIPSDLLDYKEMFSWYASLKDSASTLSAPSKDEPTSSKVQLLILRPWQWISIAAMIALLFSIGFSLRYPTISLPEEYLAYEGSYIVRDGKKITDLRIVVPEIQRTERLVNEQIETLEANIEAPDAAFYNTVETSYDLSDPAIKEIVETTLAE